MGFSLGDMVITVKAVDRASSALKSVGTSAKNLGHEFKGVAGSIQPFTTQIRNTGLALTGFGVASAYGLTKMAESGAQLESLELAFNNLSRGVDISLDSLRDAMRGTVSEIDLLRAANTAMVFDIDPQYLPRLFEIARTAAVAMGNSFDYTMNSIILGLARVTPKIIDNVGIMIKVSEVYENYAKEIGKTVDELTFEEQQTALLNAVLESGGEIIERVGDITGTASEKYAQMKAEVADLKAKLGQDLLPIFKDVIQLVREGVAIFKALPAPIKTLGLQLVVAGTALSLFTGPILLLIASIPALTTLIAGVASALGGLAGVQVIASGATVGLGGALVALGSAIKAVFLAMGPLGWAILAITAFAVAWQNNWFGIRDILNDVWKNHIEPVIGSIIGAFNTLVDTLRGVYDFFSGIWGGIVDIFGAGSKKMKEEGTRFNLEQLKTMAPTHREAVLTKLEIPYTAVAMPAPTQPAGGTSIVSMQNEIIIQGVNDVGRLKTEVVKQLDEVQRRYS